MGSAGNEPRDESQASQLLAAALRPREPLSNSPAQEDLHAPDGSSHSSNGNSVHYHMNGLMPTQSQSLYNSQDPTFGEGSQKENAPVSSEKESASPRRSSEDESARRTPAGSYPSPPSDAVVTAITDAKDKAYSKVPALPNDAHKPSAVKGSKGVSFAAPFLPISRPQLAAAQVTVAPANPMPTPRQRRSPSPASQDSFAGPLPERDPAQAFIERSKAFRIPLSRLGDDSQSTSDGEEGPPPVSNMWASRPHNRATRSPSPPGKVLVEGTPSDSSRSKDSQSQSQSQSHAQQSQFRDVISQQSSGDTQLSDFFPAGQAQSVEDVDLMDSAPLDTDIEEDQDMSGLPPSQRSDASTEPSSSYERLVNQDPFSPLPEATQPAHMAIDPTQVVVHSQPAQEADPSLILQNHDFWNDNGQVVFPSIPSGPRSVRSANTTNSTTHSTAPRGLLGLIAPHKRYRYMNVEASPGQPTQLAPGNTATDTTNGPCEVDETQIVDNSAPMISVTTDETQIVDNSAPMISMTTDETQPSHASVVQESIQPTLPKRTLPTATRMLQALRARRPSPRTEIVPDSEETRIVPDSDPPAPSLSPFAGPPTAESSPAKPPSRRGLQSEDEVLREVTREATGPSVSAIQEEEEEYDDDEDDVPLAAAVQSAKAKGKRKAVESPEPESFAVPSPKKLAPLRTNGPTQKSSSWKDAVVPSSVPQERSVDADVQPKSAKPKTPEAQIIPPPAKVRSAPRQAKLAARERLQESSSDEDEDVAIPDAEDDDKDTQPADDQMDIDQPGPSSKPARGGKRKRTVSSSARKNSSKSNGSKTPKEEAATPATRPMKRLKSGSSTRVVSYINATRVFALWRADGQYYTGTVYEQLHPGHYKIHFDDGTSADLELKVIRACRLREGDNVLLYPKTRAKIVKVPPCGVAGHQGTDWVSIDVDGDGEEKVQVEQLRLASRTAGAEWGDRMLTDDMISPVMKLQGSATPAATPAPSEGLRANRRPLHKTGLVITSSPNHDGMTRETLIEDIQKSGGVVLEDWSALFAMDGAVSQKGHRWVLRAQDIRWKQRGDVERAFLISDDNHQKPKFLIALALGIPCLSVDWVANCIIKNEELDWQPFLLPAGFSDHLNTRVSQLVDLDWGNSAQHLKGITENLVATKVFAEKAILCVSLEFLPCRGRGKKSPNWGKAEAVPQIILCMGAETVEAVSDEKHASRDLHKYDYIVVQQEHDVARFQNVATHCVDVKWVKDCLISARLLPLPSA